MESEPDRASARMRAAESVLAGIEGWLRSIAEGLIASGEIDPHGMTEEQLFLAAGEFVLANPDYFETSELSVSHEETLLHEARRYAEREKSGLALVMYATWIEHRLNLMLIHGGRQKDLSAKECEQLVRALNLPQKTGPVWTLLYGESFDDEVRRDMTFVSQERNAFVHYKWPAVSFGNPEDTSDHHPQAVEAAERVVKELERVYREQVLRGYTPEPEASQGT